MRKIILFLILILILFPVSSFGATFQFFNKQTGIADNTVTSVAVQDNAVVWVGTINALSRFDGVSWIKYTKAAGCIPDDTVWSLDIQEDSNSVTLWVGTGSGIASYDGSTWKHYQGKHYNEKTGIMEEGNAPLAGNVINKVLVQKSPYYGKSFLFAVNMGNLYKFDGTNWSTYSFGEKINEANITTIDGSDNDRLFIGTDSSGFIQFNLENMKSVFYGVTEGLPSNFINCIYADSDYDVWIGTDKGLVHFVNNEMKTYTIENSKLPSNYITSISKGFHNKIIVGTDKGIAIWALENWELPPESLSDLNNKIVWDIEYFNPRGKEFTQTWIATRGKGVAVYQVPKDAKIDLTENKNRLAKKAYIEKRYVDAINLYKELINLNPGTIDNYIIISNCYMELGDNKNTEHYLKLALKLNESSKPTLERLGNIYLKMSNYNEAEKIYRKLISLYPTDIDGYLALGRLYNKNKKWDKAISNFRKALRINSDIPSIYTELSDSYLAQGNLMKALDIALQLQYKMPDNPQNNVRIGKIYILQNRIEDAIEEINKVFLVDDKNATAKVAMARAHMEKEEYEKCELLIRESLKTEFKNGEAHALLSIALLQLGKTEDARIELNYAKSFDADNHLSKYAEGCIYEAEGNFEKALNFFKSALMSGLKTANVYYRIGNCHKSLENYDEALQSFRNVLAVNPKFKKAEDVKWIISKLETPTEAVNYSDDAGIIDNPTNDPVADDVGNSDIEELDF